MRSVYLDMEKLHHFTESAYRQHLGSSVDVLGAHILVIVSEYVSISAGALAASVQRPATSFTPRLYALETRGLIRRCPDSSDRRAVRIELTDAGKVLAAEVGEKLRRAHAEIEKALYGLEVGTPRMFMTRYAPIAAEALPAPMPE
jgi:DNA-binding MarR family transcriptional regulator